MARETQRSIAAWAWETFGPAASNTRVAVQANEEMAGLLDVLTVDDQSPRAAEEIADIVIVLYRLAERLGVNLHTAVGEKMRLNRKRYWNGTEAKRRC